MLAIATTADPLEVARMFGQLQQRPNSAAYLERMHARPAVAKAVKVGEDVRARNSLATDKEAQKILFGQRARD